MSLKLPTPPKGFWKVIEYIDWKTIHTLPDNSDIAQKRMLEKLNTPQSIGFISEKEVYSTLEEFNDYFDELVSIINVETRDRCDKGKPSFAKSVDYGGDDCHFMDMPAHLAGLGEKAVIDYLEGCLIEHEVSECLTYMFLTN